MAMVRTVITQITSKTGAFFTMTEVFQILDQVAIVATMTVQSLAPMDIPTRLVCEKTCRLFDFTSRVNINNFMSSNVGVEAI